MEISVEEMERMVSDLEEAKKEREILYNIAISIMDLMGLIDPETKKMRPGIVSGEESPFPSILKALGDVTGDLLKASGPTEGILGKISGAAAAQERIATRFAFVKQLMPLIDRYGKQ